MSEGEKYPPVGDSTLADLKLSEFNIYQRNNELERRKWESVKREMGQQLPVLLEVIAQFKSMPEITDDQVRALVSKYNYEIGRTPAGSYDLIRVKAEKGVQLKVYANGSLGYKLMQR